MQGSPLVVVLDTCVLAPMPVVDTLLRLAETTGSYVPKWSPHILEELRRTLRKFGYQPPAVERRIGMMTAAFPDAMVERFEDLIPAMTNDSGDRHVVAAAVRCGAHAIVNDNRSHFPESSLSPWGLECLTADMFLEDQYHLDPDAFISVLVEQAADIRMTLPHLISMHVPCLSKLIRIKV